MQQAHLFDTGRLVAGVDEAGRGPLAGPVAAAAVILHRDRPIAGLRDSKRLSEARRECLADKIRKHSVAWSVAWADAAEIDAINILQATLLAMHRALLGLPVMPGYVKVDGNRLPSLRLFGRDIPGEAIVRGDDSVAEISAASILAKAARDRMMMRLDRVYPHYEFRRHKGYCTALHQARLREYGPCREHRFSFEPVKAAS